MASPRLAWFATGESSSPNYPHSGDRGPAQGPAEGTAVHPFTAPRLPRGRPAASGWRPHATDWSVTIIYATAAGALQEWSFTVERETAAEAQEACLRLLLRQPGREIVGVEVEEIE